MKKIFIFIFALTFTIPAFCEAIKLKNGLIINGSIIDRSEYLLKVQTSYGVISLNQREIEKIMPDLHRVFLKGGGEYVGTVVDLDDFNLTLNTDNGLVNIDVAQIASMEIYDYEEAAKQKKYVENKIEQETQEKQEEDKKQKAAVATMGTSGLSFDEDLEKVFPSKPQETEEIKYIYKMHEDTPEQIKAQTEDKSALADLTPAEQEQKAKEEALSFDQNKKRKDGKNYFATHLGVLNSKLNIDISDLGGPQDFAVSGTGISFGIAYMRKLTSRFWYGGGFAFGMLPKKSTRYDYGTAPGQRDVQFSGQVYDFNALFNFYFNPKDPLRVYLTGGASVTSLGVEKNYSDYYEKTTGVWDWSAPQTTDVNQTVFGGNIGLGLEWTVQDINIGLETRLKYTTLKKEFSNSPKTSVLITLKTSWFF